MESSPIRVLLIEDSLRYALLLQEYLALAPGGNFEVTRVGMMSEARPLLEGGAFDAVLLDLSLPDSRGMETIGQAMQLGPDLPIIVLTGLNDEATATEAVRQGAQDFLTKGHTDGELLVRSIRYGIERKRAERELKALNDTLERRVAERSAEALQLSMRLRALATELGQVERRERRHLAKVLHDHIQQIMVAAQMQVSVLEKERLGAAARARLKDISAALREAIEATRTLAVELSPPVLHDVGLVAAFEWLARRMQEKNEFTVELAVDEAAEPVDKEIGVFLFEAVRELLFNALKHSQVRRATVRMDRNRHGWTRIVVEDEGIGFDPKEKLGNPSAAGFGLFSIQQRLRHLGGHVKFASAPGNGTRVMLLVPQDGAGAAAEPAARA